MVPRSMHTRLTLGKERLAKRLEYDRMRLAKRILPAQATSFTYPPKLMPRHVADCRVLANRKLMIRECLPKHGVVAEVGTFRGRNARTILDGAQPRELHLIDLDFSRLQYALIESAVQDGTARLHENDSSSVLASFPDEYFDWIYIDGDHTYGGVKRDIEQAKRTVKPDGLLVFNDYTFFSHHELSGYGVIHAVNELCLAEDWALRYFALQPGMYCDVAIARRT